MLTNVVYLLRPFILLSSVVLLTLLISRTGLALWQYPHFTNIETALTLITQGIRIDLSTLGYLLFIPAIIHPWILRTRYATGWVRQLKRLFYLLLLTVVFFELATPAFINEYGLRPNRLFIEYLVYPNEVAKMLLNGHLITLLLVLLSLVIYAYLSSLLINRFFAQQTITKISTSSAAISSLILISTLLLCARGTLAHRPINPSLVYFSTDPLVNSLTINSLYSVAYAYKQLANEKNAAKMYGKMPEKTVNALVQQSTGLTPGAFHSTNQPTLATRKPIYQGTPKNLVVILEESLGAQFVSSLGGLPLTPELDKFYRQGWGFSRLYATGTRSVRGIEAVITGFPPTPARAVVKLDKSQHNFFTIANLLKANNYTTQFIYGGESHFDNMKGFFLGNGFSDIVDFDDITKPNFVASWGASDQDLFTQANDELNKLHQAGKPFFSFIFTSSNHDPFEIPEFDTPAINYTQQQLSQYSDKELARHRAIQYADYALGKFINKAKSQPYWQDTIFLIVADHDARVSGRDLVPINHFHIPGVILNADKAPTIDPRIVSQMDLAPTLLSLIGITNTSPMLGHDLNNKDVPERAMMQYADNFAYLQDNDVTILRPHKAPLNFTYDAVNQQLTPKELNEQLAQTALAHALWGSLAYQNGWYSNNAAVSTEENTL